MLVDINIIETIYQTYHLCFTMKWYVYLLTPAFIADVVKRNASKVLATSVVANPMPHMPIKGFSCYDMHVKLYFILKMCHV